MRLNNFIVFESQHKQKFQLSIFTNYCGHIIANSYVIDRGRTLQNKNDKADETSHRAGQRFEKFYNSSNIIQIKVTSIKNDLVKS